MSGLRVEITISEELWNCMTPAERIAERARLQKIVDDLYEPPLARLGRTFEGLRDDSQQIIQRTAETELRIPIE